jgi:predicted transcriptional regulator
MPEDLKDALDALARSEDRATTAFIRRALRSIVEQRRSEVMPAPQTGLAAPELDRAKALFAQPQKKVADVAATPRPEKVRNK